MTAPARAAIGGGIPKERARTRGTTVGVLAGLLVVAIWSGWIVSTRLAVRSTLGPSDVAFIRYGVASLLLLPVLWQHGFALRRIGAGRTILMVGGAGAPFLLISAQAMRWAPVSHVGTVMVSAMPIFVAILSSLFLGERFGHWRRIGFAFVAAGVVCIATLDRGGPSGAWRGDLLLLAGAALWACFTVALRSTGIGAWHAAALVNTWSLLGLAPLYLAFFGTRLVAAPWRDIVLQAVVQGVLTGLVALFAYGIAVRRLGASRASLIGALTPAAAALLGFLALGEAPGPAALAALGLSMLGVALASLRDGRVAKAASAQALRATT